jgi:hypothetical protein
MNTETLHQENGINKRLFDLKFRLSAKKFEANLLFSDITNANSTEHRVNDQPEAVREIIDEPKKTS